jgi:hypothetical protein
MEWEKLFFMWIGIVGSEEAKFTPKGKKHAVDIITSLLLKQSVVGVVSGGCHLGGIDIWSEEIADYLLLQKKIFKPKSLNWSKGYKERNLQIAKESDEVYCISVDSFPESYTGMKFPFCYHCQFPGHIKSGGCWTTKMARKLGKVGQLYVVNN